MDPRETVAAYARLTRDRLPTTILPYWLRVSRDDRAGGYLLRNDILGQPMRRVGRVLARNLRRGSTDQKHLVSQARLVWVFSHAHRKGYGTEYLEAAWRGHQFLQDHLCDPERGGYFFATDRSGRPVNDAKILYGQGFVIYAFVELARASGSRESLDQALALFRVVERELHDDRYGGWREHADRDWSPLRDGDTRAGVPHIGRKSANAVVHWLEATTALYADTGDAAVRRSVSEALDLCRRDVFPTDPAHTFEPYLPDWSPDPAGARVVSYGHNVEYAWLMLHAQHVLGDALDWEHFHTYVDHALEFGFDDHRGGAFTSGPGNGPAQARYKQWWVQCELVNALTLALTAQPNDRRDDRRDDRYWETLAQTVTFVEHSMTDRRDGILLQSVYEDGGRRWPRKSGNWKAGYHDVRAASKLVDAFAP